jgi:hypothetical protein
MTRRTTILKTTQAGDEHTVTTTKTSRSAGKPDSHRREPCSQCPWRVDATGVFPAEAFRITAKTAYDVATTQFACHESGTEKPATCAGFLLRNSANNLASRLSGIDHRTLSDGGHELYDSYRSMAIANGVEPSDPVLHECRADNE